MNIRAFAESLPKEYYKWGSFNAMPYDFRRYAEVLDSVQGMTTPSNMHLLNLAVQQLAPDECYLEVGTWRGATLIGALLGNEGFGYAIDNDTMDEHDGDDKSSQERNKAKRLICNWIWTHRAGRVARRRAQGGAVRRARDDRAAR